MLGMADDTQGTWDAEMILEWDGGNGRGHHNQAEKTDRTDQ